MTCARRWTVPSLFAAAVLCAPPGSVTAEEAVRRPRIRELGIAPGIHPTGVTNAITDVAGVKVGHVTIVRGDAVRTGVTAVVPHGANLFQDKVAGAVYVGNAFGKLAGSTQVAELGTIETPIVLTNTLSVAAAIDCVVGWTLGQPVNEAVASVNAVVGETNDGRLNDIRGRHVTAADVRDAIERAAAGPVDEGSVGAGTGTVAFGWKGGIGTSSRVVRVASQTYVIGALVQANFGGQLTIGGIAVGAALGAPPADAGHRPGARDGDADGSCMIVLATDAPLEARDLQRLAARAVFGLARTGSSYANGSGDYAIAFTTAPAMRSRHGARDPVARTVLPAEGLSPIFQAVLEATEEAVYNALTRATTVTGNGRTVEALPIDRLREVLARHRP